MNIAIDYNNFQIEYTSLLDSKKNIITTEGIFTKIIFSNKLFVMNGLFFYFPISVDNIISSNGRFFINFNPNSKNNINVINSISKIENDILSFYKKTTLSNKNISYILSNQLSAGNIKVYKDSNEPLNNISDKKYILKISGIWENNNDFGITYKTILASRL
jgi:predicted transposase YbfD/YdcC